MTTPKSEEEILRELEAQSFVIDDGNLKGCKVYHESVHDWLRSALASYLMHLKESIPEAWPDAEVRRLSDNSKGYEDAVRTVHTLLDEKIRKLTE